MEFARNPNLLAAALTFTTSVSAFPVAPCLPCLCSWPGTELFFCNKAGQG